MRKRTRKEREEKTTSKHISRKATHAHSWYSGNPRELALELNNWLDEAPLSSEIPVRAIISPHAGYSYSGRTAAYVFKHLQNQKSSIKRIFILGPSHHYWTRCCELSQCTRYRTPISNLNIDLKVMKELDSTGLFGKMDLSVDEDEHSIEMQLPYIAHVMEGESFTIVPVLVGDPGWDNEIEVAKVLAPYMLDPKNFFVISSDFCHWGKRFRYTHYDKHCGAIWQSIHNLDHLGMKAIESQDPREFAHYQKKYMNTICGRRPIFILMHILSICKEMFQLKFIHYEQSEKCQTYSDSSVSYAAAIVTPNKTED